MGWAAGHIERLLKGETVKFRPLGGSMNGKVDSGQLVTVEPLLPEHVLKIGDIVLCKVHGNEYLHLIKDIRDNSFLIGNNRGGINGWISIKSIYGRCTGIQ